jgi:hypothetical protein
LQKHCAAGIDNSDVRSIGSKRRSPGKVVRAAQRRDGSSQLPLDDSSDAFVCTPGVKFDREHDIV